MKKKEYLTDITQYDSQYHCLYVDIKRIFKNFMIPYIFIHQMAFQAIPLYGVIFCWNARNKNQNIKLTYTIPIMNTLYPYNNSLFGMIDWLLS